ncbi:MAG: TnpV protein, partial [Faecousia sp.]
MNNTLTYRQNGDYLIPNLELSEQPVKPLGKYGRMRKTYLKEHRPILYSQMLLSEKLYPHLLEIDETANSRLEQMIPELAKAAGATEALKASDPMRWVGLMNNCKAQAE